MAMNIPPTICFRKKSFPIYIGIKYFGKALVSQRLERAADRKVKVMEDIDRTHHQAQQHEGGLQRVGIDDGLHSPFEGIEKDHQQDHEGSQTEGDTQVFEDKDMQHVDHEVAEAGGCADRPGNDKEEG